MYDESRLTGLMEDLLRSNPNISKEEALQALQRSGTKLANAWTLDEVGTVLNKLRS